MATTAPAPLAPKPTRLSIGAPAKRAWLGLGRLLRAVMLGSILPLALLATWHVVAANELVDPTALPSPRDALRAAQSLWDRGVLPAAAGATITRVGCGFLIAGCTGVLFGSLLGEFRDADDLTSPIVEFLRVLPASTIVPVALLIFGPGPRMEVGVVAMAATWPVLLSTMQGVHSTDPQLVDLARSLRHGRFETLVRFKVPSAIPEIFTGLRLSLAIAFIVGIAAEMLGSQGGLGHEILISRSRFRAAEVYAMVWTIGIIGFIANLAFRFVARRIDWTAART
jgi:ABC-type nitrate/sulfonate/bicarbonate transport system permease component